MIAGGLDRVARSALGPYQTAVVRIGIAGTWLLSLLREWPNRHELYGPDGPYSWELATSSVEANDSFTILLWSAGAGWFEFVYLFAIAASLALVLGWRTRTASVLFMVGVLSVQNRNGFVSDGGDNVIHLLAIYLVFARCGQVWSLDARRARSARSGEPDLVGIALWSAMGVVLAAVTVLGHLSWGWALMFWGIWLVQALWWTVRRYAPGEPYTVSDMLANLLHNGALLVIIAQVCLLYATAGWYKVQGSRWQDGTAAYYPMHVDAFTPWPALSDALSSYGLPIMLMTWGTVIVQVAFPFTLFYRPVKNVLLACLIAEHIGIGILLGLPFFSLAVIAADLVFLPTNFLHWVDRKVSRKPGARGAPGPGSAAEEAKDTPALVPAARV